MNVLGSVRLSTLIHVGAVETLATILICYAVAVTRGHVKPWLPMISDCAVYPPEKYPFRFGLALSSFFIGAQTVAVHVAKSYSKVSLFLGLLASLSLGIVSVVNEDENNSVHGGKFITRPCKFYNDKTVHGSFFFFFFYVTTSVVLLST